MSVRRGRTGPARCLSAIPGRSSGEWNQDEFCLLTRLDTPTPTVRVTRRRLRPRRRLGGRGIRGRAPRSAGQRRRPSRTCSCRDQSRLWRLPLAHQRRPTAGGQWKQVWSARQVQSSCGGAGGSGRRNPGAVVGPPPAGSSCARQSSSTRRKACRSASAIGKPYLPFIATRRAASSQAPWGGSHWLASESDLDWLSCVAAASRSA